MNMETETFTVGFIGGGNMAHSIIGGLIPEVLSSKSIYVFDPNAEQLQNLAKEFDITPCHDNHELVAQSDVIVIAVKPQVMSKVLTPISHDIADKKPLLISVAAGISCELINTIIQEQAPTANVAVIRVMPNTPALVKAGASGLFANEYTNAKQKSIAETLMKAVGSALWVDQETDIDAVTALSGSGPAYFMLFVQSLIDSATKAGLNHDVAKQLAIDTCAGSAKLMQSSELPIEQLIKNVTSPRGTTEQALLSFQSQQLPNIIDTAFNAALNRSIELGEELKSNELKIIE